MIHVICVCLFLIGAFPIANAHCHITYEWNESSVCARNINDESRRVAGGWILWRMHFSNCHRKAISWHLLFVPIWNSFCLTQSHSHVTLLFYIKYAISFGDWMLFTVLKRRFGSIAGIHIEFVLSVPYKLAFIRTNTHTHIHNLTRTRT